MVTPPGSTLSSQHGSRPRMLIRHALRPPTKNGCLRDGICPDFLSTRYSYGTVARIGIGVWVLVKVKVRARLSVMARVRLRVLVYELPYELRYTNLHEWPWLSLIWCKTVQSATLHLCLRYSKNLWQNRHVLWQVKGCNGHISLCAVDSCAPFHWRRHSSWRCGF